jgi:arsenate reductase
VKAIIYHNPRCSKSRETLALLREHGVEPTVIEYLRSPPDTATLQGLLRQLGRPARDLLRRGRGEAAFGELDLAARLDDEAALIAALVAHPVLLERPVVVIGERAAIGRPPEAVLTLLTDTTS